MRGKRDSHREQSLRTDQTHAEALLWHQLRNRSCLRHKFRRQVRIGRYIADFVCNDGKLIVELDGSQHQAQAEYDLARTRFLESRGFRVLRFWNNDVMARMDAVLGKIVLALQAAPHPALRATPLRAPARASPGRSYVREPSARSCTYSPPLPRGEGK